MHEYAKVQGYEFRMISVLEDEDEDEDENFILPIVLVLLLVLVLGCFPIMPIHKNGPRLRPQ